MAVDLGSEFLKVALVQPGRIPISIVINEISKRKTPALVGFVAGDRLVGEEAASLQARHPAAILGNLPSLLGRDPEHPVVRALAEEGHILATLVPGANLSSSLALRIEEGTAVTAEELVASVLEYSASIAAAVASDGLAPRDVVLVTPASFGPRQRQALLDAAAAARLTVLGLVSPTAAAALQYGIDRTATFVAEGPQHVLLFDLGSGGLEVALARFSTYTDRKGSAASQVEILDVAWDEQAGTQALETLLLRHFTAQAATSLGQGLAASPRAIAKLRVQVQRVLRVLSANAEAPLSVEELHGGKDFRSSITREAFESLAGDYFTRVARPASELLARNGLDAKDLAAVELLGGGSRIPRVKSELSAALGGRGLDVHLDADEAAVLGAGLVAANRSTQFRVRPFGLVDRVTYGVEYALNDEGEAKTLVPAMKRIPSRRAMNLAVAAEGRDEVDVHLSLAGGGEPLGDWSVAGLATALAAHANVSRVALHARVDDSGVFSVDSADMSVVETSVVPAAAANATQNATAGGELGVGNASAPEDRGNSSSAETAAAGTAAPAANETAADAGTTRTRTLRIPLELRGGFRRPGLSPSQLRASRAVLARLAAADAGKRAAAHAKNDLEAYIIDAGSWSAEDEDVQATSTEGERTALGTALEAAEDWLYGDGDAATLEQYVAKLAALKKLGEALRERAAERRARPEALAKTRALVGKVQGGIAEWAKSKPWLTEYEIGALKKQAEELTTWLDGVEAAQAKKKGTDTPAFTSVEVQARGKAVAKASAFAELQKRPAPPTPKDNATDATTTTPRKGKKSDPEAKPKPQEDAVAPETAEKTEL